MNTTVILSTPPFYHNGTYKKNSKSSNISGSLINLSTDSLDNEYQQKDAIGQNNTFCKSTQNVTLNGTFSIDKRMSVLQHVNDEQIHVNEDYDYVVKRNSVEYSGGSADSLDRMSSLSNNSSGGSSRMLNMSEVDAIVERQEQSRSIL